MKGKNNGEESPLMLESEGQEDTYHNENPLEFAVSRKRRTRKTSMVINDTIILLVELFQILSLIQSMSLRWAFPDSWINATYFIFWINLDFWDFFKVYSGTYKGIQNYDTPSAEMPFSYDYYLLFFGVSVFLTCTIFAITYLILRFRRRPYLFVHVARMLRAITIICQIFTIPIGLALFRLFQCNSINQVDVMNDIQCFTGIHWAYILPSLLIFIVLFVVFPGWMLYRIRREVLAATKDHHESYLQLKEMEYMSGLDVIWVVKGFHLFSSFNLRAVWYRPIMQIFKLILLAVFAGAYRDIFAQALSMAVVISAFWLIMLYLRPFRITSFNVLLLFGYLCLMGDVIFGACIAYSKPSLVESPWLVQPYAVWVLGSINILLLLACTVFVVHLSIYTVCCYRKMGKDPIWPSMVARNNNQISQETKKYMYAVLKGRALLDKCRSMPALFSPVHELTREIQIINAYLRESEKLEDGLHDTLWDLLDEMIDTHQQIEPKSLFADDVKENIRYNAEEFLTYMPSFSRRLAQRDYDFILVSPLKKRLLLKMNIVAMFLHGRKYQKQKKQMMYPEMLKMWPKSLMRKIDQSDGEYCDDLYPERLLGPDNEEMFETSTLQLPLELIDIDESDETESTATLLKPNSVTDFKSLSGSLASLRTGKDNPGFKQDEQKVPDSDNNKLILTDYEIGESSVDDPQVNMEKQARNLISLLDTNDRSNSDIELEKLKNDLKSTGIQMEDPETELSKQPENLINTVPDPDNNKLMLTDDEIGESSVDDPQVNMEKQARNLISLIDTTDRSNSDIALEKLKNDLKSSGIQMEDPETEVSKQPENLINFTDEVKDTESAPTSLKISGVEEGETTTDLHEIDSNDEETEEFVKKGKKGKGKAKGKGKTSTGQKKGKKKK